MLEFICKRSADCKEGNKPKFKIKIILYVSAGNRNTDPWLSTPRPLDHRDSKLAKFRTLAIQVKWQVMGGRLKTLEKISTRQYNVAKSLCFYMYCIRL